MALGLPELRVAVNLSALQFKRGDIEKSVAGAIEASGIEPYMLELELTESILISDTENILSTVKRLKSMGVRLSIDDFGTGYSSLSHLKRFEVDKLKIDQSFIRDLATDPEDAAIVRAIIQMARSLGLRTVAEGVEKSGRTRPSAPLPLRRDAGVTSRPTAAGRRFRRVRPGAVREPSLSRAGQSTFGLRGALANNGRRASSAANGAALATTPICHGTTV